jgi:quinolinate synthase
MEALVSGRIVNQIQVEDQVAQYAKVALERMLALP